jgi:hypothetical protein
MDIDFQELLGKEQFRASVGPEKLAIYSAEVDGEGVDQMVEDLDAESVEVLRLSWLGGCIDGGFVQLLEWHGFYLTLCTDSGYGGPFESFEEALRGSFDHYVPQAELDSDVLTLDHLMKIALAIIDPNGEEPIKINRAEYELRDGELV